MKNYFKIGILLFGALLLTNCSKDSEENIEDIDLSENKNTELLKILHGWGYTDEDIKEYKNSYVVEGDIVFYKDRNYSSSDGYNKGINSKEANVKQQIQPGGVLVDIRNIKVYINPGMDNDWISASVGAIARWDTFNCLTLTRVYNLNEAHIEILYDTQETDLTTYSFLPLGSNIVAQADYPSLSGSVGIPGKKVWINHDIDINNSCDSNIDFAAFRIANIQHELGHTLGLRHTNEPGNLIPGTPPSDPLSVMNGNSACTINVFSDYDRVAVNYLFPCPALAGAYLICGTSNQTYTLTGGKAISWQKSSNLQIISSTQTSVIVKAINSSTQGAGYVEAETYSGTKRYDVWIGGFNQGTLIGTSAVCISQAYYYTFTPPGGHKPGYTYRWTLPNSSWYIYGNGGNTIYAGPSGPGSNSPGQILVEVNNGCGGWSLAGGLITYPSYSCP